MSENTNKKWNSEVLDCRNDSFYTDSDLDGKLWNKVWSLFLSGLENITYEDSLKELALVLIWQVGG